jgi:NADPH-dependent 2,4-dienoyl-CoA reductase/sulfur reductase-like enzyme/rhodanese-related sulfurtransferase
VSNKKIVVIGGVAAGTSAAAKARRCDEDAEVLIFERGRHISYATCGLPYYISGVIAHEGSLIFNTPETFETRHNIDVKLQHEVSEILPECKEIKVIELKTGQERRYPYDKLILATGARPFIPPIEGIQLRHIHSLRTVEDAKNIRDFIETGPPSHAVVVGGGLIGLEMVEALLAQKLHVTLVEKLDQLLPSFDWEIAHTAETHLKEKGVDVFCSNGVESFKGDESGVKRVVTESGEEIDADLVILSIGIRPNVQLAEAAGIQLGPTRTIAVNHRMETSVEDIYAVGDCAESRHILTDEPVWAPLGSVANKHGRVAGENVTGRNVAFKGVLGTCIAKVCDLAVARTGLNEKEARERRDEVAISYVHPADHTHCYPGSAAVTIKTIADAKDGRLLGAQLIGSRGIDKRVDVMAMAIYGGMTVGDLFHVDLAYAPPFSPAKDPVLVAGVVTENELKGDLNTILPLELKQRMDAKDGYILLDVRTLGEFAAGHLEGATHIHVDELRTRIDAADKSVRELEKGKGTIVYCQTGIRSYRACRILMNRGFQNVRNFTGGLACWKYGVTRPETKEVKKDAIV